MPLGASPALPPISKATSPYLQAQARVVVAWLGQFTVNMMSMEELREGERFEMLCLVATLMRLASHKFEL